MNRSEALAIVREYVKNENLVKHMLSVEAAMRFYAEKFGEEVEKWGITGLLHDFDWEIHSTLADHPAAGEPIYVQTRYRRKSSAQYFPTPTIPASHARRAWKRPCMHAMKSPA